MCSSNPSSSVVETNPEPVGTAPANGRVRLTVNGTPREFVVGHDVSVGETLAHLLREGLGLTGVKVPCEEGACGGCTVIVDGRAVLSCMVLAVAADGADITTIEGLSADDPVVRAFAEQHEPGYGTALQCGICTPGFVMASKAFLADFPEPTMADIKRELSGNICRCGCYAGIAQAVLRAAEWMKPQTRQGHDDR
jgi:aerobic-type carbon monoxide dehydrogenase small subunit (CoxS/CutS family)